MDFLRKNITKEKVLDKWILFVLAIIVTVFSMMSPVFLSKGNFSNILRSMPTLGVATLALTILIITGGVDLSFGAIVAFSGTMSVSAAVNGFGPIISILIGIFSGAVWGYFNGFMITKFKLQPFIVTLGSNYLIRGLILMYTNGVFLSGLPDWYYKISNTKVIGTIIHSNTVIFLILVVATRFLMRKTRFGRHCYSVGSNKEASRLSGINVERHIRKVYMLEGSLAGVTGIILMSYLNVGASSEAMGLEAYAIASSIIGGTQFGGGIGSIGGAAMGLLTIEVFKNGLAVVGINSYGQQAVTGVLILLAMVVDYFRRKNLFSIEKKEKTNEKIK